MATSGLRLVEVNRLKIPVASPCSAFIMVGDLDRQPNLCEEVVRQNVEAFIQIILFLESIKKSAITSVFRKLFSFKNILSQKKGGLLVEL